MHPIDLHTHSTRSDGTLTPAELIRYAAQKGLAAIALTDHDTIDGIEEAVQAARSLSSQDPDALVPEVIPGVELSTEYRGKDIHIVGLFIDWQNREFADRLRGFADARIYRNRKMCSLLTENGCPVSYEDLEAAFPDTVITRAHFAQYLLDRGMISSIDEAFRKLIGDDCPCFVPREKITPHDAVRFLLRFGGVPILAHPLQYKMSETELDALVASQADTANLSRIAEKYGLLLSGGSDFHGTRKQNLDLGTGYGHLYVPDTILPPIRERALKRRQS